MKCAKCHQTISPPSIAVAYRSKSYCPSCFSALKELTPLLRRQLADYHSEKRWSWKSIELAARYFFELTPHEEIPLVTLGILPYVYDEAMSYYRSLCQAQEFNQAVSLEEKTRYLAPSHGCASIESSFRMEDL